MNTKGKKFPGQKRSTSEVIVLRVEDICEMLSISRRTYFNWKEKGVITFSGNGLQDLEVLLALKARVLEEKEE